MTISAENIGKKFGRHWVFRNLNIEIKDATSLAITGSNGSGKSTLLQILAGYLTPTEGSIYHNGEKIGVDQFSMIGFTAPYIEIPEELTFRELISFHSNFRRREIAIDEIAEKVKLPLDKPILEFSTGMKQRVQLSTIFYFQNEIAFMDEPTANLDESGYEWWADEAQKLKFPVIVASNQTREIDTCEASISLLG